MTSRILLDELNRATTPIARPNPLVVLWRWRYELGLVVLAPLTVYYLAAALGPMSLGAGVVPVVVALWPPARSEAWGRIRCVATAHRIRVGFVEAYVVNRRGKIPVILWCAPAPCGERAWVWCRAGITLTHLERARETIASACWASEVRLQPHHRAPHWVLLEVVRRGRARAEPPTEKWPARGQ